MSFLSKTHSFQGNSATLAPQNLVRKLQKEFKTLEDAKFIYSQIKSFTFFNKFIDNHFSNSMDDAVLYVNLRNPDFSRRFLRKSSART